MGDRAENGGPGSEDGRRKTEDEEPSSELRASSSDRTNDTRYVLTGRVDQTNDALRLVLRLYEREKEIPKWTETFVGTAIEVLDLEQRAINAIARRLDRPVPEEVQRQIDRTLSNNLAAYRRVHLALGEDQWPK
jgi:hypothetical protein